ncbi:hypothetical protein ACOCJ7_03440 [Knoellia sp. CPCC 206453]
MGLFIGLVVNYGPRKTTAAPSALWHRTGLAVSQVTSYHRFVTVL